MNAWHELDRRCTATNRYGERCARAPIVGGTVCVLHGGASPNAIIAARSRLLAMVEPVLGTFEEILAIWHSTRCDHCGKPTGDPMPVIRVGQLVLDRAGFAPSLQVQMQPPENKFDNMTADEVVAHIQRLLAEAIEVRDLERRRHQLLLPPANDAVLIEEGCEVLEADELRSIPPEEGTKEPASD